MSMMSMLRYRTVALSLAATVVCALPALAQSGSPQNANTGCYSGSANDAANYAQGCKPDPNTPPAAVNPAAAQPAAPGAYGGNSAAQAKGNANSGESCAPPPGTAGNPQDLAKALQQTNTKYDQDCAAAYKNQQ